MDRATNVEAQPLIALEDVGLAYQTATGALQAVERVSFTVHHGEFVAILGPSGCGKSTLLRMIAGLAASSSGQLLFGGKAIAGPHKSVGMVFQAPNLLPWRRAIDNVLLAAELSGLRREHYRKRADALLEVTGLHDFRDRLPAELSGGMQQRLSLCRALLLNPPVLLMDEPFGALDAMTRDEMNLELLRIWEQDKKLRKTILFVTHSIPEAIFLADRVVVMTSRPGKIARIFDVPLARPRTVEQRATTEFGRLTLEIYETFRISHPASSNLP
jgi:NitT/TauT family transport system ATP-binding protein